MPFASLDVAPRSKGATLAVAVSAAAVAAAVATVALRRRKEQRRRRRGQGYSLSEVAEHGHAESVWIILHGEVYDATPFIEEHPGAKRLLLAVAGMDATDAFAGMDARDAFGIDGHSQTAERVLQDLHIGYILAGPPSRAGHDGDPVKGMATTGLTGGYQSKCNDGKLWEVKDYGFLPARDPVGIEALNGTGFEGFAYLAELLPSLTVTGALRKRLQTDSILQSRLRKGTAEEVEKLNEDQLERAFSVVAFCITAYSRGGRNRYGKGALNSVSLPLIIEDASTDEACRIPDYLSIPMLAISAKLNRQPVIDYASTVLYNWERIDPSGPLLPHNIRTVVCLTGLSDEEWFFKTHVVLEAEAAPAVASLMQMMEIADHRELLKPLLTLEETLSRVVRACMPIIYERAEDGVPRLSEHIFHHIIRPMISTGEAIFDGEETPRLLNGLSGAMTALLPAVDAALGIKTSLSETVALFEKSMPQAHQGFLARLREHGDIRMRILFSRPIAGKVDEHHESLVRAFNRCIARVLDFRWQRWHFVKEFILKPGNQSYATGTGGTTFEYLQQHITDTESARLTERTTDGFSLIATPADVDDEIHLQELAALQPNHQPLGFWSVDGPHGLLAAEPMLGLEDWDLWRASMPPQLHEAVLVLLKLAASLPALCLTDGRFYDRCEEVGEKLAALRQESLIVGLSEANRERLLTLLSHVAAGCSGTSTSRTSPECIERPWQVAAGLAGRSLRLDVVPLVLANWTSKLRGKSEDGSDSSLNHTEPAAYLRNCLCLIASPDEEWYRSIHIVLHEHARDVVAAIRMGQAAALRKDDSAIVKTLQSISAWLNKFCDYFDANFEQRDSRLEAVMMRRLSRVFGDDSTDEETACWVYCGGNSVLLPMLHGFLGIQMARFSLTALESADVERFGKRLQQWVEEMGQHMPIPHRAFLEELQRPGASVRQYCLKRFGTKDATVELLHDLEVAYNEALNALARFLSRRRNMVVRFLPHVSSVFGAMHAHLEATARRSRLPLLKMRQRADASSDKPHDIQTASKPNLTGIVTQRTLKASKANSASCMF